MREKYSKKINFTASQGVIAIVVVVDSQKSHGKWETTPTLSLRLSLLLMLLWRKWSSLWCVYFQRACICDTTALMFRNLFRRNLSECIIAGSSTQRLSTVGQVWPFFLLQMSSKNNSETDVFNSNDLQFKWPWIAKFSYCDQILDAFQNAGLRLEVLFPGPPPPLDPLNTPLRSKNGWKQNPSLWIKIRIFGTLLGFDVSVAPVQLNCIVRSTSLI